MPLFEYRCENGHLTTKLRRFVLRDTPLDCPECGQPMEPIISAPHVAPDGTYSYAPNLGRADAFDRKKTIIEERESARREGRKPKLGDSAV